MIRNLFIILMLLLQGLLNSSCQRELQFEEGSNPAPGGINYRISIEHRAGNQALQPNLPFTNPLNETYSVSTLKYYVSGIELQGNENSHHNAYFLVDLLKPSTLNIVSTAKAGSYSRIRFLLGVDSIRNVSGAQTGALDPVNGMFWTWNTGYIMFKLEGTSTASREPDNRITYHIGGFNTPVQTQKEIVLTLPETINLSEGKNVEITIRCNVNGFFNAVHVLPIAGNANCTAPGPLAAKYADNYQQIFTVTAVSQ